MVSSFTKNTPDFTTAYPGLRLEPYINYAVGFSHRLTIAALGIKLNDYWREKMEKKAKERAFQALERKGLEGNTEKNYKREAEEEEEESEEEETM